jgi:hypothetical protein
LPFKLHQLSFMTVNPNAWTIFLGASEWAKHTYAREPGNEYRLIGRATRGMQYGALAINQLGEYFLINGDHVTRIHSKHIKRAVDQAKNSSPTSGTSKADTVFKPPKKGRPLPILQPEVKILKRRVYQHG